MKKIFIGIDFAKEKIDVAIIEACGLKEFGDRQYGTFSNDKNGYRQFIKWVKTNCGSALESEWLFCGEDTGSCSIALSRWLYGKGLDIWIENAYSIKHSSGIQRVKTDKADASMIAEYAWRHQDKAQLFEPLSDALMQLREVFLYRHKLVQQRVAMEVRKKDKDLIPIAKITAFISRKGKHLIAEFDKAIKECDEMIDHIINNNPELAENYRIVTSIKGVARQNGACLLIYTNNFKRFNMDARKIACYYGVAPFGKESGSSIHSPAHTSHFANRLIKSLLSQAAQIARIHNPEIRDYYDRLIKRGKKHSVAINNIKNKLLRIIVALIKKQTIYDPEAYKLYQNRLNKQFSPS